MSNKPVPAVHEAMATEILAGLAAFDQDFTGFQPIWFSVKEMGFSSDVEQVTSMSGHILTIRKTRRHSVVDPATGTRVAECLLTRIDPDYGRVMATGELRACSTCPFNKWGSAVDDKGNPGKGKACREKRLILFLRDGDALPVVVAAPPKSIRAVDNFRALMLTKGKPLPVIHVTLSVERVVQNGNSFGVLKITPNKELTPAEAQDLWERVKGIQAMVQKWLQASADTIDRDDIEEAERTNGEAEAEPEPVAAGEDRF